VKSMDELSLDERIHCCTCCDPAVDRDLHEEIYQQREEPHSTVPPISTRHSLLSTT